MNPYTDHPTPLPPQTLYVLFALARYTLHAYAIKSALFRDSVGSLRLSDGRLYTLIARLHEEGLIDLAGTAPAGKSGKPRMHYTISKYGNIRLQEELQRLDILVQKAKSAHLLENDTPTDIQRLMLSIELDTADA